MKKLPLLLAALLAAGCRPGGTQLPPPSAEAPPRRAGQQSYADVVDRVAPAVVTVRSERVVRPPRQFPFLNDPLFRQFFGGAVPRPRPEIQHALGSGVTVTPDGYIITNHHVIDGAEDIRVEYSMGRNFSARVVGSDPPSDIAVLKVDASGLPVLAPGNSDAVRVGDVVLALGNPLGVGQTVTMGIVSAKGRWTGLSDGSFEDFLQTDAPINQGNSGGALVNTASELIGINSQILSTTGGNIGIGFAIPSNMAREVMNQLVKHGQVRRGQLGIAVQPLTQELATGLGLKDTKGVLIADLSAGSPADRAGLRRGDVIRAINGQEVNDPNSLRNRISSMQPGSEVTLTILRNGQQQQVKATLGEFHAEPRPESPVPE